MSRPTNNTIPALPQPSSTPLSKPAVRLPKPARQPSALPLDRMTNTSERLQPNRRAWRWAERAEEVSDAVARGSPSFREPRGWWGLHLPGV